MKTLFLLRHAKSSRDEPDLPDMARPLNARGRRDAPRMGRFIAERQCLPDAIVSSPAVRARSTGLLAAEAAHFVGPIRFDPRIYEASVEVLVEIVRGLPDGESRVLLVGHNPGLESLIERFSAHPEHFPTAALAEVSIDVGSWRDTTTSKGRLIALWRPKSV